MKLLLIAMMAALPQSMNPFTALCSQPGVVLCVPFDDASAIPDNEDAPGIDNWQGIALGDPNYPPTIDTVNFSNGTGSLLLTVPASGTAGAAGYFYTNMDPNFSIQFTEGAELFIQWRQMFDSVMLAESVGGNGWKTFQLMTGDTPTRHQPGCGNNEIVLQNTYFRGFPQGYDACEGHASYGPFQDFYTDDSGIVETSPAANMNMQQPLSSNCRYDTQPRFQDCVRYFGGEWMTFQLHIILGPLVNNEYQGSTVQLFIARQGQDGVQALNIPSFNLNASSNTSEQNLGRILLDVYNTNRSGSYSQDTYVWYDDLIVSTQPIAMVY
jgi:hypothetical protein